jgi:death-associated protein kinase
VDVLQTNLPGVGDVSLWEFSGQECYYGLYDHFIGNTNCIHLVLYSLADPLALQLEQVTFWLSFLQSRIPPVEPLGDCGRSHKPAFVVLVATHGDLAKSKTSNEELRRKVEARFGNVFTVEDLSLVVDSHAASSQGLKALKASLLAKKQQLIEGLPRTTQFLELVLAALPEWISALQPFPAVTWPAFIDYMHTAVNPLAGEEHLKEVIQQLQLMGEVVYLKCDAGDDLIILDPKWLCGTLSGLVLSPEFRRWASAPSASTMESNVGSFPALPDLNLKLLTGASRTQKHRFGAGWC